MAKKAQPEFTLQRTIVQHLRLRGAPGMMFFHPANEGRRSIVTGANLKLMGMLPGVADLVIIVNGQASFLEIKAKGGKLSPAQLDFMSLCAETGCDYAMADTLDAALTFLTRWGALLRIRPGSAA